MKWNLVIEDPKALPVSKAFLKNFLQFIEKALQKQKLLPPNCSQKQLVTAFISLDRSSKLNKQFLNKNKPADVLSFDPLEPDSWGELALCGERIRSQAKAFSLSLEEQTAFLILHGFLHLLGYTHEQDEAKAQIMFKIQDEIFEKWRKKHFKS